MREVEFNAEPSIEELGAQLADWKAEILALEAKPKMSGKDKDRHKDLTFHFTSLQKQLEGLQEKRFKKAA